MRFHLPTTGPLFAVVSATALLAVAPMAGAQTGPQGPYANVNADASCVIAGTDLLVNAALTQKPKEGASTYEVPRIVYTLEQKFPGTTKFVPVISQTSNFVPALSIPAVAPGATTAVDADTFASVCTSGVDRSANSIRGVVEVTVANANPSKSLVHLSRCLSLPNPCR